MKYSVLIHDHVYEVEIVEEKGCQQIYWEGERVEVDCLLKSGNPSNTLILDGLSYEIALQRMNESFFIDLDHTEYDVLVIRGKLREGSEILLKPGSDQEIISAPMPGMVVSVKADTDRDVKKGEPLLILEAMKMENELRSPVDGRVQQIHVRTGKKVEKGEKLITLQK